MIEAGAALACGGAVQFTATLREIAGGDLINQVLEVSLSETGETRVLRCALPQQ
jgi:uncharacterized membrane protein